MASDPVAIPATKQGMGAVVIVLQDSLTPLDISMQIIGSLSNRMATTSSRL
jgi:hypothetical protein